MRELHFRDGVRQPYRRPVFHVETAGGVVKCVLLVAALGAAAGAALYQVWRLLQ